MNKFRVYASFCIDFLCNLYACKNCIHFLFEHTVRRKDKTQVMEKWKQFKGIGMHPQTRF